jgi:ribosomal protein S2
VTIRKRIGLLDQLEARQQAGDLDRLPKKEAAKLTDELNRLQATLGGIRRMKRVPGAVFIVDPHRERIAVTEANRLEIPVVGTGDTNVDPDELSYIIPANDDAIRSIRLLCTLVADAAIEGAQERASRAVEPEPETMPEPEYDDAQATDELVAALAGGGALSFAPDEDDDLLPGGPGAGRAEVPPADDGASPEEIAAELARQEAESSSTDKPAA